MWTPDARLPEGSGDYWVCAEAMEDWLGICREHMKARLDSLSKQVGITRAKSYALQQEMLRDVVEEADVVSCDRLIGLGIRTDSFYVGST